MKVKRYILIVALAAILVGIAYIRALFSNQDRISPVSPEAAVLVPPEILDEYIRKDEAATRLDSVHRLYVDSLEIVKRQISADMRSVDSATTDSLQAEIDRLTQRLDLTESAATRADKEKRLQFEKLVAAFYKGEIRRLPNDLSSYEHKVSVEEIRSKAMNYFEISSKDLSRIINKYR
ncbi:MAG: hypothetical protein ACFFEW_18360 [Candidatus Thorarchaeota archaeon]